MLATALTHGPHTLASAVNIRAKESAVADRAKKCQNHTNLRENVGSYTSGFRQLSTSTPISKHKRPEFRVPQQSPTQNMKNTETLAIDKLLRQIPGQRCLQPFK